MLTRWLGHMKSTVSDLELYLEDSQYQGYNLQIQLGHFKNTNFETKGMHFQKSIPNLVI